MNDAYSFFKKGDRVVLPENELEGWARETGVVFSVKGFMVYVQVDKKYIEDPEDDVNSPE